MSLAQLKRDVFTCAKQMAADQLAHGSQGNISAIDRATNLIAITPSAADYASMTPADIVVVDLHGNVVDGRWKPTIETPLHTTILRNRPDVGAVVHCHAPHVSGFAAALKPIPIVLSEAAACVGRAVPCAPMLPSGTQAFADLMLAVLGAGSAAVMGQHGLVTCGPTLKRAYATAIAVEDSARACVLARALGFEAQPLPDALCDELHSWWLANYSRSAITVRRSPARSGKKPSAANSRSGPVHTSSAGKSLPKRGNASRR